MKKLKIILAIAIFMAGIIGIGCKSDTTDREADAVEPSPQVVEEAKEDSILDEMRAEQIINEDKAAWALYKAETNTKLKANEKIIHDLKMEIKAATKKYDETYLKDIELIEQRNTELNKKVDSYTVDTKSDWEDFKKQLNREMDNLGKSIADLKHKK